MTNIFNRPEKRAMKKMLFRSGIQVLEDDGWRVGRMPGIGKSSVRQITKDGESRTVAIRTTQDGQISFFRNKDDTEFATLADVNDVIAVSVDHRENPKNALVHFIDGNECRDRFERTYAARKKAGRSIPVGRGVWLPLYLPDSNDRPEHVGAGLGLDYPPIARIPLMPQEIQDSVNETIDPCLEIDTLTIAEIRHRLGALGVTASNIKIIIEIK